MNSPVKRQSRFVDKILQQKSVEHQKKIKTRFGYLYLSRIPDHQDVKIKILVKKNTGKAVYRNYVKRIIRAYIRQNRSKFVSYNDFVFHFNYADGINFADLKKELDDRIKV